MASIGPVDYLPDTAVPPGLTISDLLQDLELSVAEFADLARLTEDEGFDLINGGHPIDEELARFLAEFFRMPMHFWMNLERNYRQTLERVEAQALQEDIAFSRRFPLRDMIKFGWIAGSKRADVRAAQLLEFLGIRRSSEFNASPFSATLFRRSKSLAPSENAMIAWLTRGRQEAAAVETAAFDPTGLSKSLGDLRAMTRLEATEFGDAIQATCGRYGVAVVYVPAPERCTASGAAYKVGRRHVVQLSLRHKRNDHFWFSLFHELAHVILHSDGTFVDDFESVSNPLEAEADRFASDLLLPPTAYNSWRTSSPLTSQAVREFADRIGIAPGIVVGRLQRDRLLGYERLPELFQAIDFEA